VGKESVLEKTLLVRLNRDGHYAWKNASVGVYDQATQSYRRPHPFQIRGVSDIIAFIDGVTHFIEVKRPGEAQNEHQKLFEAMCHKRGIPYWVVRQEQDLEEIYQWSKRRQHGSTNGLKESVGQR
jgi:hypothetical protein